MSFHAILGLGSLSSPFRPSTKGTFYMAIHSLEAQCLHLWLFSLYCDGSFAHAAGLLSAKEPVQVSCQTLGLQYRSN